MSIERSAGILMPVTSLPSKYGIGTLGKEAYRFIDFLVRADQSYWQVLPLGHTSYGDSPYQCFSSFAGNPYLIDLDMLEEEGLLDKKDLKNIKVKNEAKIDYGTLYNERYEILHKAYLNGKDSYRKQVNEFEAENSNWLEDYALFMALKKHFDNKSWLEWEDQEIRFRSPSAITYYRDLLKEDVLFYKFIQFLFFKQFRKLKEYADLNDIRIIGDLPIYVAMDSCEVWADPRQFQIDEGTLLPKLVAGVPPDYFAKDGQLWGNPLYDWEYMRTTGYKWWLERIDGVSKMYDVIRIDHFRAFEQYYAVPYGEKTAKNGRWINGPSINFVAVLRDWFSSVDFIAEDLGMITESVTNLLKLSGFPGMRVLEFSLTLDGSSTHSPHHHTVNSICYTGTHDNAPVKGWVKKLKPKELEYAKLYYGLNKEEGYNYSMIRAGMSSVAKLFICQIQDYLGLDEKATINTPGTMGNWTWRLGNNALDADLAKKIKSITYACGRSRPILENSDHK